MPNHPYFLEEKILQHNQELKEIDRDAWKWSRSFPRKPRTFLSGLFALIGF
ncbi:hypothetical protein [Paenibacillus sedimenti]|uniref:Uncharacterized protein n=1 Tax=Paenibacillus sedimenti TaxID=2770274 RepID=A0A926KUP3_9BACL|nr:hypothetical protein [Paenibacillus sedimenti]MBD0383196.1 hypothetical protein [Paenibacillus sedimenti]